MSIVLSVNVSGPRTLQIEGREVRTGILKTPAAGPVRIGPGGLEGDARVAPRQLGDAHHAVYAYPRAHYAYWEERLGEAPLPPGIFGENLTVEGPLETEARIGDVIACGSARLQVAQPRTPCFKLKHRLGLRSAHDFLSSRRVGYYLRVLDPGVVGTGDRFEIIDSDGRSPTVDDFQRIAELDYWDARGLRWLLESRDLVPGWVEKLEDKLARAEGADGWFGFRELEVARRRSEAPGVVSLDLRCPHGRELPTFEPGQALTIKLRAQEGTPMARRRYYVVSPPDAPDAYRITVQRPEVVDAELSQGLLSSYLIDEAGPGSRLRVAAPRGGLTLGSVPPDASPLVLASAEIGVVATLALLRRALADRFEAPLLVLHETRDPDHHAFAGELAAIASAQPGVELRVSRRGFDLPSTLGERAAALLFGPADFLERVGGQLREAGVPPERIQDERC